MYFMFDIEDNEDFVSKEVVPDTDNGLDTDASIEEKMKRKLHETLTNNTKVNSSDCDIGLLLIILSQDKNPDDDIFEGHQGNYTMGEGFVSSDFFRPDTENGSPQTINGLLEFTVMAKACTGSAGGYFAGAENDEQFMMASYAAELVGMNMHNKIDTTEIDPVIKQNMDQAWGQMKQDLNITNAPQIDLSTSVPDEPLIGLPMSLGMPKF